MAIKGPEPINIQFGLNTQSILGGEDEYKIRDVLNDSGYDSEMGAGFENIKYISILTCKPQYLYVASGYDFGGGDFEEGIVACLCDSNWNVQFVAFKSADELGMSKYNNYRMIGWGGEITQAQWDDIITWFALEITTTYDSESDTYCVSSGNTKIYVNKTTHAMRYGEEGQGLRRTNVSYEYNILETNGWLVVGTYNYGVEGQEVIAWNNVVTSIRTKSQVVKTINAVDLGGGWLGLHVNEEQYSIAMLKENGEITALKCNRTYGYSNAWEYNNEFLEAYTNITEEKAIILQQGWDTVGDHYCASIEYSVYTNLLNTIKQKTLANNNIELYYKSSEGLISLVVNGTAKVTLSDKNLGATVVFNDGDTADANNCGGLFQWGNNHMFPYAGSVTTSRTKVDASNYGPGNYYDSSTFVLSGGSAGSWQVSINTNLRGNDTGTVEARRGPCQEGYHIPNRLEMAGLFNTCFLFGVTTNEINGYLKLSKGGIYIDYSGVWSSLGRSRYYCSEAGITATSNNIEYCGTDGGGTAYGFNIRPFKNEIVTPDNTRTLLYSNN